jgi:DNA primase catalytic core
MFNQLVSSCNFLLNNFAPAQLVKDYLNQRLSQQSQDAFQFGYFPDITNLPALTSLIDESALKELKLLYSKSIEDTLSHRIINLLYFENYPLIIPFKDHYGNIVALVGRTLLPEDERKKSNISKYKNTIFQKGNFLFGLYENKKSIINENMVYVVEGQFDVIKAYEHNFNNVVALSNSNMSDYQLAILTRYTNNIFLLLDNDEAGEKGRKRIINKYSKFANIKNLYLPEQYKDIDEYFSNNSEPPTFVLKE